jgi:hypothetical protein
VSRVEIQPRATTAAIGLLMVFSVGGMVIGALLIGGAGNIAKAQGGSALQYMITGGVFGLIGAVVLAYARRQMSAIREIIIDANGWTLLDRRGRTVTFAPGATVVVVLRCRREVYSWGGIPRIRDVVDGIIHSGPIQRRLAPSGPVTYGEVLPQLGIRAKAPPRGHTERHSVTVQRG